MVKSEPGKGLIYSGDTPLSSTIVVEQSGPMQLTVRAGYLTTTGQARIVPMDSVSNLQALIEAGRAEMLPDGQRARIWLQDGGRLLRSQTLTLAADTVFDLASDPDEAKYYQAMLGIDANGQPEIVMRSRFDEDEYPDWPQGWQPVQELVFEFMVPPGCSDLAGTDIYVLRVEAGFPPGTRPDDWRMQVGGV
jgi:hypothetical protein